MSLVSFDVTSSLRPRNKSIQSDLKFRSIKDNYNNRSITLTPFIHSLSNLFDLSDANKVSSI